MRLEGEKNVVIHESSSMSRMNKFFMGLSILVKKEYHTAILPNNMEISRLMVYAQQIEESKLWDITRDGKRPISDDSSPLMSKKRFYNQDTSMGNKYRVFNQNCQEGGYAFERPRSTSCRNRH